VLLDEGICLIDKFDKVSYIVCVPNLYSSKIHIFFFTGESTN